MDYLSFFPLFLSFTLLGKWRCVYYVLVGQVGSQEKKKFSKK